MYVILEDFRSCFRVRDRFCFVVDYGTRLDVDVVYGRHLCPDFTLKRWKEAMGLGLDSSESQSFDAEEETDAGLHAELAKYAIEDVDWGVTSLIFWPGDCVYSHIEATTASHATLNLARSWPNDCLYDHPDCKWGPERKAWNPSRLLDLQPNDDYTAIRLCEGEQLTQNVEYIALSHCWGQLKFLTLNTENLAAMKTSISVSELTKTFQDAITIARRLQVRYL